MKLVLWNDVTDRKSSNDQLILIQTLQKHDMSHFFHRITLASFRVGVYIYIYIYIYMCVCIYI